MAERLLVRWDDFSQGMGYLYEGGQRGVFWAVSFYGRLGELSPIAKFKETAGVFSAEYLIRHGFVNNDASGDPHLYLLTDSGSASRIHKFSLKAGTYLADEGNVLYAGDSLGHPVKYKGNWYYTEIGGSLMRKLVTTGTGNITGDTITDGDAGSGDGHLFSYGHQIAKVQETSGISILKTGGDANVNADWSSPFPVGDSNDTSIGAVSLQGLAYVLRGKGLYTFNDRGRAGSVFEDHEKWQQKDIKYWSITTWLGGLVYTRLGSVYYWQPGKLPIDISMAARGFPHDRDVVNFDTIVYKSITSIGNFLYVWVRNGGTNGVMCGEAINGDPTNISWWNIHEAANSIGSSVIATTEGGAVDNGSATTVLITQGTNTISIIPLAENGSPRSTTAEYLIGEVENSSRVYLPYLPLVGTHLTKLRIMVEGLDGTVSPSPTTRAHFAIMGDTQEEVLSKPVLADIYQDGVTEINLQNISGEADRLSLVIRYINELPLFAVQAPIIRWIEVYGE